MKIKYSDLERIIAKLSKHSQKGDIVITVSVDRTTMRFEYVSNVGTDTEISAYDSELNKFVCINEKKWLHE